MTQDLSTNSLTPESLLPVVAEQFGQPSQVAKSQTAEEAAPAENPPAELGHRIMIVDDEPINIKVARKYLKNWGYQDVHSTTESVDASNLVEQLNPDLILLDVMMPGVSGLEVLQQVRANEKTRHTPVIILTAHAEQDVKLRALDLGANDFLAKPIDPAEMLPRIRNVLAMRSYQNSLQAYSQKLEIEVRQRTAALEASYRHIVNCLARAAEFRDNETGRHVIRVGLYAGVLARHLNLSADFCEMIEQAAKLHDVGKIGIPDEILLKTGRLDPEEYDRVQRHCGFGRRVFDRMPEDQYETFQHHAHVGAAILEVQDSPLMAMASRIALTHHEAWDGSGYPLGLAGEEIPLEGRITAVVDVFDALSSRRPYKPAFPLDKCLQILTEGRGTKFEPRIVDAFIQARQEIVEIQIKHADTE